MADLPDIKREIETVTNALAQSYSVPRIFYRFEFSEFGLKIHIKLPSNDGKKHKLSIVVNAINKIYLREELWAWIERHTGLHVIQHTISKMNYESKQPQK